MRDDKSEIVGGGRPPALEHMTEAEAVRFGVALCDALLKNRPKRGWHGALHPANLSYTTDGRVLLGPPLELISSFSPEEVEYLAPELFWNGTGGPATDVYAVGLLLYAACSGGRPPFTGESGVPDAETRAAAAASRMKGEVLRAPKSAGDELAQIILRATAYKEEERWPDVESLRAALEDCSVYAAAPERPAVAPKEDKNIPAAPPPRAVEPGMKNAEVVVPVPPAPQPTKSAEKPKPERRAEKKPAPEPEKKPVPEPEKKSEHPRPPEKPVSADDIMRGAERAAEAASAPAQKPAERPKRARSAKEEPIPESYPRPVYDVFNEGKKKKRRSPIPALLTILALAVLFIVFLYYWKERDKMPEITPTPDPTPTVTEQSTEPTPTPTPWRPSDPTPTPDPNASPEPDVSPSPAPAGFAVTRLQIGSASRDQAASLCAQEGGHLPVINSQEDFDALVAEADRQGLSYVWLDAKKGADGVWRTSDGAEVSFFKWFRGEPSGYDTDGTSENCLMLWKYNGVWGYNDMRNDPGTAYYKYYGGRIAVYCQKDE